MSKVNINQLDKADTLPFRCNRAGYLATKGLDLWDIFDYKDSCVYEPWKLAERIIENNIGKSFDLTYSYFCKKIKYDQDKHIFLDKFRSRYSGNLSDYIIDDNGNIQIGYKKKSYIRHIIVSSWDLSYNYSTWNKRIVMSGQIFEFESKDYKYYREYYHQEFLKRKVKKAKKQPKLSNEEFRRLLKEKELKERQLNLIKIESHGFDINTSFRK